MASKVRSITSRDVAGNYLQYDFSAIPNELKRLQRWVCWQRIVRSGKPTKVPIDPKAGRMASCTDAGTWGTYAQALSFLNSGKATGIGFVLGPPYSGSDLDRCRNPKTGVIEPRAAQIIDALNSYTEVSPSGAGVHILVKGALPEGGRRKGRVEMYESGRYFTMTGLRVEGAPATIESRQAELNTLHAEIFGTKQSAEAPTNATSSSVDSADSLADDEIIMGARRLPKFKRLWDGDWTGYDSQSEADLALCLMLADWTARQAGRIDGLFRRSKPFRPKWDEQRGDRLTARSQSQKPSSKVQGIKTDLRYPAMGSLPGTVTSVMLNASSRNTGKIFIIALRPANS
jgi:putative DNA primase/helicase